MDERFRILFDIFFLDHKGNGTGIIHTQHGTVIEHAFHAKKCKEPLGVASVLIA
jgi:hypothetical protein